MKTDLTELTHTESAWILLKLATIDAWPVLLDDRSMKELLEKEPELLDRSYARQNKYMTQPGNNQPMPLEAFIYVLKSIFGPDINKAKDFKYTGQLQYKMGDGQTGRISPSDGYEHCIAEFNVSFLDSSRGKDGDWAMVKKLEKHIEDRREQIIEYREKQLLTRPKKNFFSFR